MAFRRRRFLRCQTRSERHRRPTDLAATLQARVRFALALVFERERKPCAVGYDFAVLHFQVQFIDLGDAIDAARCLLCHFLLLFKAGSKVKRSGPPAFHFTIVKKASAAGPTSSAALMSNREECRYF